MDLIFVQLPKVSYLRETRNKDIEKNAGLHTVVNHSFHGKINLEKAVRELLDLYLQNLASKVVIWNFRSS
jgi:hypothetical protein